MTSCKKSELIEYDRVLEPDDQRWQIARIGLPVGSSIINSTLLCEVIGTRLLWGILACTIYRQAVA